MAQRRTHRERWKSQIPPSTSTTRGPASQVPAVLPQIVLEAIAADTLVVTVNGDKLTATPIRRSEIAAALRELVGKLGSPTRVEVREMDGSIRADILTPPAPEELSPFAPPATAAQSLVILVAVLFGFTLPLQPAQILWVNLITAVTLSLALAYEPAEPGVMLRRPRKPGGSLLGRAYLGRIFWVSLLISGATIAVFFLELAVGSTLAEAQTTAVTMLTLSQVAFLFNSRFLRDSSLNSAVLRGNPVIWISTGALLILQLVFVYTPFMNLWFRSAPIGLREWGYTLGLSAAIFLFVEIGKAIERVVARKQR